jgi:coenzyme F420-0:L-glutamate ligase / coenzyme F420-1:gamma-L-glutamate ligase
MHILPLPIGVIRAGDDVAAALRTAHDIRSGDIIVVSSKAIAIAEGAAIDLSIFTPSKETDEWSVKSLRSPSFIEAVLQETKRLNGNIVGSATGALLTRLKPDELSKGTLLVPNAGLDESNIEQGYAIGWPHDPVASAMRLREELMKRIPKNPTSPRNPRKEANTSKNVRSLDSLDSLESSESSIAVIITDSCCVPGRLGVTAFALAVAGIDPFKSEIGSKDLFGKSIKITVEAIADQLAVSGNMVMGNVNQSVPAVVIRDHDFAFSDFHGWVQGIEPNDDLFRSAFAL